MSKELQIRNSTVDFLIFQLSSNDEGVEVYYKDETIWCSKKAMSILFDCSVDNIGLHLKNIYAIKELEEIYGISVNYNEKVVISTDKSVEFSKGELAKNVKLKKYKREKNRRMAVLYLWSE